MSRQRKSRYPERLTVSLSEDNKTKLDLFIEENDLYGYSEAIRKLIDRGIKL